MGGRACDSRARGPRLQEGAASGLGRESGVSYYVKAAPGRAELSSPGTQVSCVR